MSEDSLKNEFPTKGMHANHRQRMREKFKKSPDLMTDHELLEMLLYYTIPRRNTNETAHEILRLSKNSLKKAFMLDRMQLKSVKGIGEKSAEFFALLKEIMCRIEKENIDSSNVKKLTTQNIKNFLIKEFYGLKKEQFLMICVDMECNIINKHILSQGSETSSTVSMKEVVQNAVADRAAFVFMAHNHPNGLLIPSDSDIEFTKVCCEALALIEVAVIEHYIVTDKDCMGIIKKCGLFKKK